MVATPSPYTPYPTPNVPITVTVTSYNHPSLSQSQSQRHAPHPGALHSITRNQPRKSPKSPPAVPRRQSRRTATRTHNTPLFFFLKLETGKPSRLARKAQSPPPPPLLGARLGSSFLREISVRECGILYPQTSWQTHTHTNEAEVRAGKLELEAKYNFGCSLALKKEKESRYHSCLFRVLLPSFILWLEEHGQAIALEYKEANRRRVKLGECSCKEREPG